jgi:hypothetical protein
MIIGMILSDASLRKNGKYVNLRIQQTHLELTKDLWFKLNKIGMITNEYKVLNRKN